MKDRELLKRYTDQQDENAFDQLVKKYYPFVFRTVHVRLHDSQLAEDTVLTVFLLLAQKAAELGPNVVIAGWLFKTAHLTACNAARMERNRRKHETEAVRMALDAIHEEHVSLNEEQLAIIDNALMRLSDAERNAVLLRIGQGMTISDTAEALRCSPDAANKRASRGLERIRKFCLLHGTALSAITIIGALTNAYTQIPSSYQFSSDVLTNATAMNNGSHIQMLIKGASKTMKMTMYKQAAAISCVVLLLSGVGYVAIKYKSAQLSIIKMHNNSKGDAKTGKDKANSLIISTADKNEVMNLAEELIKSYKTASKLGTTDAINKVCTLSEEQSGSKKSEKIRTLARNNVTALFKAQMTYKITGKPYLTDTYRCSVPYKSTLKHDCIVYDMVEGKDMGPQTVHAGTFDGEIRYRNDNPSHKWLLDGGI